MPQAAESDLARRRPRFRRTKPHFRGAAMKPRQFVRIVAFTGTCLLLSSCGGSKNPLSDPMKAKPDAQLVGIWRTKDSSGVEYVHVGRAGGKLPQGIMHSVSVTHNHDGTLGQSGEWLVFSTNIDKNHYLNVVWPKDTDKGIAQLVKEGWKPNLVHGYCLVRYEVQGDALSIWIMDKNAQRRVIQAGKIKGTVDKDSAMFTDTTENLAAMLAAPENADLFKKEPTDRYERVK
jgi:hypothetical protein